MTFDAPVDFDEAIDKLAAKKLLPAELSSRELQQHASAALRERAFFSARVLSAQLLQGFRDGAARIVKGTDNRATIRAELKLLLQGLEYVPEAGTKGTLQDLSSNARLNLVLDTNVSMVRGFGQWQQGNSEGALDAFPAQELVRVAERQVPREWEEIWEDAMDTLGGSTTAVSDGGRFVAMKNDPIWMEISDFGLPYPPFKFNSGMDVEDVSYEDAADLGVMDEDDDPIAPPELGLNDGLESSIEGLDGDFPRVLGAGLSDLVEISDGILRFKNDADTLRGRANRVLALLNEFDASEPRDAHGRWMTGAEVGRRYQVNKRTRLNLDSTAQMLNVRYGGRFLTVYSITTPEGRVIERSPQQIHEFLLGERNSL